ncbi:putative low-complexity protein [Rubidibacter lacunae KORDI 51-2]|uniref:Putative low-complexity protein n=1 Tax=Rubidibacter lacunae KORDI 51-2 TaxID=582515 RepID=U5DFE6_9CHRO|nr:pentapeptide repeat-containing protein [Rubidibacter lacunae]ERN40012.1 putative low-complexity protein [Rubidibacter lacunae KORDI 51-2]
MLKLPQSHCVRLALGGQSNSGGTIALRLNFKLDSQPVAIATGRAIAVLKGCRLVLKAAEARLPDAGETIRAVLGAAETIVADEGSWGWELTLAADETYLQREEKDVRVTLLPRSGKRPWQAEAHLIVTRNDLQLLAADGLWRHDIRPNAHAILLRRLALALWDMQNPTLTSVSIGPDFIPAERASELVPLADEAWVGTLLATIADVPTDEFQALCERAELDPLHDFAGANLRGVVLSGLDLAGANLARANLRGAELNDVDFNEADLRAVKLSGADLSGAYLGAADLRGANLHKAGLALTNLSGADLRGADLTAANLSDTNFSGAQLVGACFGDNPGLSGERSAELQARGAQLVAAF